jgi:lysophospholipase L1-like esterase
MRIGRLYLGLFLCFGAIILSAFYVAPKLQTKKTKAKKMYTYLALGDSYTIGEQVHVHENFPYQTVNILKNNKIEVADPVIVAKTGWTTDELAEAIREHNISETFSFVTLLIGVNNQYRGRHVDNYREEFTQLLSQAITFADGHHNKVFVLSIPDWGVTPFANTNNHDRQKVAQEIDNYNAACKEISLAHKCHFIEITGSTRDNGQVTEYLAGDGLHPSPKEYAIWAKKLADSVAVHLKQ